MKKFLSMMLAVAMIVSLSSVAFADTSATAEFGNPDGPFTVKVEDSGRDVFGPIVGVMGPYSYDSDDRALYDNVDRSTDSYDSIYGPVEFGEAAYYALLHYVPEDSNPDGSTKDEWEFEVEASEIDTTDTNVIKVVKDSEVVSNLKIKAEWEEGGDLVKSIKVIKRKIVNPQSDDYSLLVTDTDVDDDLYYPSLDSLGLGDYGFESEDYVYFLVIEYEESTSYNDADLIGTITLNKSKDPEVDDLELDIGFGVDWQYNYRDNTEYLITDDPDFEFLAEKNYALKFKGDDEVELTFEDESTFTVDISGQSKILFNWNNNYISKVAAKYPYAELNFWNGNGAKFNRVGEFFLNCEDLDGNQFLYQVNADGTLSEVPGAEWDESDEGFYFNTRVLGSYVVSDMELDVVSSVQGAVTPSTPVVSAPVVTNPSTGVEG